MIKILIAAFSLHQFRHCRLDRSQLGILVHLRHRIIVDNTEDQYRALLLIYHLLTDGFLKAVHFEKSGHLIHIIVGVLKKQITTKQNNAVDRICEQITRKKYILKDPCCNNRYGNRNDPALRLLRHKGYSSHQDPRYHHIQQSDQRNAVKAHTSVIHSLLIIGI